MCENDVFVLPVNILTGVARQLLGPNDTLPCVLIAIFASVRKDEEEKKTKKEKRNFGSSYLGNGWSDFLQIWNVDSLGWRATV